MPYEPPSGYKVGLTFVNGYVVPAGYKVGLEFVPGDRPVGDKQYLYPGGFGDHAFGLHAARLAYRGVKVSGFDPLQVGAAAIWNKDHRVEAKGFDALSVGQNASIINRNRYIQHGGSDYFQVSTKHEVWLWERHIKLEGRGMHTQAFGTQWASHYLRYVTASRPADLLGMGRPWAVEDPRYLNPKPIEPINITDRHVVGGLRFIEPVGTEMTEWGTRIIPQSNTLYHHGLSMQAFGDTQIKNHLSYVAPKGFGTQPDESLRFGYLRAWNLTQYIQHEYDPNDGLNPGPFGQWTAITNRNREPQVYGWQSSRFGYQFIWNKAAPIKPSGVPAPAYEPFYKAGAVTHKNRPVVAHGINSLAMSGWGVVTNAADPLKPFGHDSLEMDYGHSLENRSRQYKNVGNVDTIAMGTPFIADAIREITFEPRYSIEPPRIELPMVDLYTRYVEDATAGEGKYGVGMPALSIHWRIITPRWSFHPPAFIGEPSLRNVTPELYQRGHNSEDYGVATLRTQWREVLGFGDTMTLFGRAIIRDRTHRVEFAGALPPPNIMPGPVVTRIGGLPDTQRILPRSFPDTSWLAQQVPKPIAGAQSLYPAGTNFMKVSADLTVAANSIRIETGVYPGAFGVGMLSLKDREVILEEKGIAPITAVGIPRSTPHTIYAVKEAPEQAKRNHLAGNLHYVGENVNGVGWNKGLGRPMVSILHRWVRPSGIPAMDRTDAGRTVHKIYNAKSWIEPKPIKPLPVGIPEIPGTKAVEQYGSVEFMVFGKPKVAPPPYTGPQYIKPNGMQALATGAQEVEFLHRKRTLTGWNSLQMGASKPGDTPYMWQGLRVGPMVPVMIEGFDASSTGEPWISFRVREVLPEGYNAMASEYDLENFHARMRVWRRDESIPSTLITAGGIDGLTAGVPNIANRVHYILPDGNTEQYRKGAPNA